MSEQELQRNSAPATAIVKKEIKSSSNLTIFYPDFSEIWKLNEGIPENVVRYDQRESSIQSSHFSGSDGISTGRKIIITSSLKNIPQETEKNNVIVKKFSEAGTSIGINKISFPEYGKTYHDRTALILNSVAFLFSLTLLTLTVSKHVELETGEAELNRYSENIRLELLENQKNSK